MKVVLPVIVMLTGCMLIKRSGDGDSPPTHRVMVVDSDFDESLPIFAGKIAGTYTRYCKNDVCELKPGLQYRPVQDSRILLLREKWNNAVKAGDFSTLTTEEVQYVNKNTTRSHGTATAAVIAYDNPNVQLYLVQLEAKKDGDDDGLKRLKEICQNSATIEVLDNLLKAEKAEWTALAAKPDPEELALHTFAAKNGINLINESYGSIGPDTYVRELFGKELGCPTLGELIIHKDRLKHERIKNMGVYRESVGYLTLQSAGNEESQIDSGHDTAECIEAQENHLLVGSFDAYGRVARFSNFGTCVAFYTLGSKVITATAGDVLLPVDGTSFSSPLAVRFLTSFATTNPKELKSRIIPRLDNNRFLKMDPKHTLAISFEAKGGKGLNLTDRDEASDFFGQDWEKMKALLAASRLVREIPAK